MPVSVLPPSASRLRPAELADAAVLGDLAVLVVVLARLTPFSGLTTVVGAIPFAVLGLRHRARVLATAFWIAAILVFLLAGFSASTQVLVMATFGGVVGRSFRNGWSRRRTVVQAVLVGWTVVASLTVGFLAAFAGLRRLNLEAVRVQWNGIANGLRTIGLDPIASFVDPRLDWILDHWWLTVPLFQLVISIVLTLFVVRIGRPIIGRVQRAFGERPVPDAATGELARQLCELDGFTLVAGPNGSGKSTLLRAIADQQGRLGAVGGTAVIGQRPESQVIGSRVVDDLAWGLVPAPGDDAIGRSLAQVGLAGFDRRETSSLSGGELQRLAIASALLRSPAVLLSDESTAMIDPAGRSVVIDVLRGMADRGVRVIHVSHLDGERAAADRVVEL